MKKLSILVALFGALVWAGRAEASFHLNKVNEVVLSVDGNTSVQYVELFDATAEPFPPASGPYSLEIFDADGTSLGSVTLDATALADAAAAGEPFLVSTAAADTELSVTGDAELTVALPADGQACFVADGFAVNCLGWGTINTPAKAGETIGEAPADGSSLSRQDDGTFAEAEATPGTANAAPSTPEVDAGTGTGGGTGGGTGTGTGGGSGSGGGCSVGANTDLAGAIAPMLFGAWLVLGRRRRRR